MSDFEKKMERDMQIAAVIDKFIREKMDTVMALALVDRERADRLDEMEGGIVNLKHAGFAPLEAAAITMIAAARIAMEHVTVPQIRRPALIALQLIVQEFMHAGGLCGCPEHADNAPDREPTEDEAARSKEMVEALVSRLSTK